MGLIFYLCQSQVCRSVRSHLKAQPSGEKSLKPTMLIFLKLVLYFITKFTLFVIDGFTKNKQPIRKEEFTVFSAKITCKV